MNHARDERRALADLMAQVGPDAPTLCEGWTTSDLAAHLIARDRRPDSLAGLLVKPLAGHTESVRLGIRAKHTYDELVELVRSGPPAWSPTRFGPVDSASNTAEYFIHHEDVRRAQPGWQPRALPTGLEAALWSVIKVLGRVSLRASDVPVTLSAPQGTIEPKGGGTVTVTGTPSELLLFLSGRKDAARVSMDGPSTEIARLEPKAL
jgi:uncharacterized protein (TIGR03085 family)